MAVGRVGIAAQVKAQQRGAAPAGRTTATSVVLVVCARPHTGEATARNRCVLRLMDIGLPTIFSGIIRELDIPHAPSSNTDLTKPSNDCRVLQGIHERMSHIHFNDQTKSTTT